MLGSHVLIIYTLCQWLHLWFYSAIRLCSWSCRKVSKMGVVWTSPQALAYGPLCYGSLNIPNLYTEQLVELHYCSMVKKSQIKLASWFNPTLNYSIHKQGYGESSLIPHWQHPYSPLSHFWTFPDHNQYWLYTPHWNWCHRYKVPKQMSGTSARILVKVYQKNQTTGT